MPFMKSSAYAPWWCIPDEFFYHDGCPAICPRKGGQQLRHCKEEGEKELESPFLKLQLVSTRF